MQNGRLIEDPETIAEKFNEFFVNIDSHLADKIPKMTCQNSI